MQLPTPELIERADEEEKEDQEKVARDLIGLFTRQKPKLDDKEIIKLREVVDLQDKLKAKRNQVTEYDRGSQVFWLRTLERALRKVSNNKLKLNEFALQQEPPSLSMHFEHAISNLEMTYVNTGELALLDHRDVATLANIFRALRYMDITKLEEQRIQQLTRKYMDNWHKRDYAPRLDKYRTFWDHLEEP